VDASVCGELFYCMNGYWLLGIFVTKVIIFFMYLSSCVLVRCYMAFFDQPHIVLLLMSYSSKNLVMVVLCELYTSFMITCIVGPCKGYQF